MKSNRGLALVGVIVVAMTRGKLQADDFSRGETAANPAARSIHAEAGRILGRIQLTEYRHETAIDENKGTYYCDCSGFVGYVLNRTVARDDPAGPLGNKKRRPLAMDYEKALEAAPEKVVG